MRVVGWLLVGLVVAGCVRTPVAMEDVMPGELFAPGGEAVAVERAVREMRGARYVLVGEGHTVACDHRVQADVLDAMVAAGERPVLGLEMVPVDLQPVLDRFNAGEIGVDDLEEALDWEETWGHAFVLYAPIFKAARRLGVPVVALNVPKRVVRAVSEGGVEGVDEADRGLVPGEIIGPMDSQREMLEEQFQQHRDMMGEKDSGGMAERFMLVQSLWDTAMASNARAAQARLGRPVLVLAGSGHVEYGWGIAHRLRVLDPGARVVTVLPWRGLDEVDPDGADWYFYCAQTSSSRLGFTLKLLPGAAEVEAVAPGTKVDKAGFKAGDRIVTVQGMPVQDLWVLHKAAVQAKKAGEELRFGVERGAALLELHIALTGVGHGGDGDEAAPDAGGGKLDGTDAPGEGATPKSPAPGAGE